MKHIYHLLALTACLAASVACGRIEQAENPAALDLTTKSAEFVQKGHTFSFRFIEQIDAEEAGKDYIVSPLGMQILLGMVLDGARGETAAEICHVLGYGAGETEAVNDFALSMLKQLPGLDPKTAISMADAIFVDDGCPLTDSYKNTVKKYYQAEVANLDFSDNERSLEVINGWCSDHTRGLIPEILDKVDPNMLAYLLNALYFKGQWTDAFPPTATVDEAFVQESGSRTKVRMMKQVSNFAYCENKVFQAVRLPYGNGAYSLVVLLPKTGYGVSDVTSALTKTAWPGLLHGMDSFLVDLWLPRFETRYRIRLNDILSEMGMPSAFDASRADFQAMSPCALRLSFVQQDAFIRIDEEGTEAAAVSSAAMMKNSVGEMPDKAVTFHADHPFLYLIAESSTGAVLFAGRYNGSSYFA